MPIKIFIVCLCPLILLNCGLSPVKEEALELKNVIEGIWSYQEKDTTYTEVIFSDKIEWGYDDKFGLIAYDYEVTNDNLIRRFYIPTHDPFINLHVKKFSRDTISVVSESKYQFTLYRLNLGLDINKIIDEDSSVVNSYLDGLRNRKFYWETKNRSGSPKRLLRKKRGTGGSLL